MSTGSSAQQEYAPIEVREIPLTAEVGRLRFTKALIEVNPPGPLAVAHYAIDGKPQDLGIAMDLDKGIFIDACEEVDVTPVAAQVRKQILRGLRG